MTTMKKCLLLFLFAISASEVVYARTSTAAQISDLSRKLSRLEQKVSTLQRDVDILKKTNGQLTGEIKAANNEIERVSTRNAGLQEMLDSFEKFFGKLYSESGAFDNPTAVSVDKKINEINSYIGNGEAELIEANPNYLYTVMGVPYEKTETNVTEELVESAVLKMATDSHEMQKQVDDLEARVVEVSNSKSGGMSSDDIAQTYDRLDKLEDMMRSWMTVGSATARNPAEQKIYNEMVEDQFFTERSASTSRKSVFSVYRSNNLFGTNYGQIITFNREHVNKGRDFKKENGTFVCQWTGYYHFTFTLRSMDDHYIGVTLMKSTVRTNKLEVITSIYTDVHYRSIMQTQNAVLHLATGDQVWLRLGPSDRYGLHSDAYNYITFTGFLIYKGN